ncbi:MAG: hypothetical protein Q8M40_06240 [Legionella sp.]|nr:hypothetical protein [Legionella sp.]
MRTDLDTTLNQSVNSHSLEYSSRKINDLEFENLIEGLKTNPCLTKLNLFNTELTPQRAQQLAAWIKISTSLTDLDLGMNNMGDAGIDGIAEALISKTSLRVLNLTENYFTDASIINVAKVLEKNTHLKWLSLAMNYITALGMRELAKALNKNTSLTQLSLFDNAIGNEGLRELSGVLKSTTTLTVLDLGYIEIDKTGIKDLAESLMENTTLVGLDLMGNQINDEGIEILVEGIKTNTSLSDLNLELNEISNRGAKLLGELLNTNKTIHTLSLNNNQISNDGLECLAQAFKHNSTLTHIQLYNNKFDSNGVTILAEGLAHNTSIISLGESLDNDNELSTYLKRNQQIKAYLNDIYGAIIKERLPSAYSWKKLFSLIPKLEYLPKDGYLLEAIRLFRALSYRVSLEFEQQLYALKMLLPRFHYLSLQNLADKSMGLLLAGDLYHYLPTLNLEREGQLLSLYAFRNHLDAPELKNFLYIVLFHLLHGNTVLPFEEKQKLETCTLILSQQKLIELIKTAVAQLEDSEESAFLLNLLLAPDTINLYSVSKSPAFIRALKAKYSPAQMFTTVNHCLLAAHNQSPLTIPVPENSEFAFEKALANEPTETIEEIVAELKNSFSLVLNDLEEPPVSDDSDITSETLPDSPPHEKDTPISPSQSIITCAEPEPKVIEEEQSCNDNQQRLAAFIEAYEEQLAQDRLGCFGFFRKSRLKLDKANLHMQDIYNHALHNHGHRTRRVLEQLGWLDAAGKDKNQTSSTLDGVRNFTI